MSKFYLTIFLFVSFLSWSFSSSCFSFDPQGATYSIGIESKDISAITEVQKINELLDKLEKNWNEHNIEDVMNYYSEDFVNGDGLDLESVIKLTKDLWEAYPDIKSKTHERTVRIYADYATVESTDFYYGESANVREEVGTKGILKAVSVGNLFLKKYGPTWKIISDKTLFEKLSIGYGIGNELIDENKLKLSAPEQIPAGKQYTARLDFNLSEDVKPVAAISKELLIYPHSPVEDKFRLVSDLKLEKFLTANNISKNELITATIGLTGGTLRPKLLGLVFLTRRVNVIPISGESLEISIIKSPARSSLSKEVDFLDIYTEKQKTGKIEEEQRETNEETEPSTDTRE